MLSVLKADYKGKCPSPIPRLVLTQAPLPSLQKTSWSYVSQVGLHVYGFKCLS